MTIKTWLRDNWEIGLLAGILLFSLPAGLTTTGWLRSNDILWWAAFVSLILGLLLGRGIRRFSILACLALITGTLFIIQVQSRALPPLQPALRELVALGRWVDRELSKTVYNAAAGPDVEPLPSSSPPEVPEWHAMTERLLLYGWNLQAGWPPALKPNRRVAGQVLQGSLLGLLVWITVLSSTWLLVRRGSAWGVLLPILGVLTLNIYYSGEGWEYLVLSLSTGMLLAGIRAQQTLEGRWGSEALPYWLRTDRWLWAGTLAMLISLAMLLTIKVTDPDFQRQVREILYPPEEVAAGPSSVTGIRGTSPGTWPREHLLGSGPDLSTQMAMSIRTPGVPPAHFYWRATSYDQYTGHGWISNAASYAEPNAAPIWPELPEPPSHFVLLRQIFRMETPTPQVYAAGRPVRLSLAAEGRWSDPLRRDLVSLSAITPQAAYEVLSWIPSSSPDELRDASDDYPAWVKLNYLDTPDDLPGRVVDLAEETTAGAPTAYDQALAIQGYLRENYSYTLDLDTPPADRDVIDYFLFDLKRGYCDYYASAMTIMARSAGLPARLAVGYATGTYDPESESYQVSKAEAHSWVEIYFPEFGWIAFEPTSSRPVIEHDTTSGWVEEAEVTSQENIEAFERENRLRKIELQEGIRLLLLILASIILTVGGIVLVWLIGVRKRKQGTPEDTILSLYRDLLKAGRRLGLTLSPTQTPHEFLYALQLELAARAQRGPKRMGDWETRLEQANRTASRLVSLYVDMCYSSQQLKGSAPIVYDVLNSWPHFSRAMWMFRLVGREQVKADIS
ncbi:MAG: transglutaminase domain-containing protein [Anaerolineae bacterium]|nr:transglutaminase domain-containing protein [Anaerolineae bacterium]